MVAFGVLSAKPNYFYNFFFIANALVKADKYS